LELGRNCWFVALILGRSGFSFLRSTTKNKPSMQTVKVKRLSLLEKLQSNRKAHRDIFLKAQEGYRIRVIQELDQMLAEARAGKSIRRAISLPEPQDHTADYDRVIAMLEMSVEDEVQVFSQEFDMYVMDNWAWKPMAKTSHDAYLIKR
jgi:hypothetical protein